MRAYGSSFFTLGINIRSFFTALFSFTPSCMVVLHDDSNSICMHVDR